MSNRAAVATICRKTRFSWSRSDLDRDFCKGFYAVNLNDLTGDLVHLVGRSPGSQDLGIFEDIYINTKLLK